MEKEISTWQGISAVQRTLTFLGDGLTELGGVPLPTLGLTGVFILLPAAVTAAGELAAAVTGAAGAPI